MDARFQRAPVVVRPDGDRFLQDDGAGVHAGVDQMDGHAGHLDARGQRIGDRVGAGERGQQRGVHVQPAVAPPLHHRRPEHPHVAGAHDEVDAALGQRVGHGRGQRRPIARGLDHERFDRGLVGAFERPNPPTVRKDEHDVRPDHGVVQERLQVGSGAGDQHRDTPAHQCGHASRARIRAGQER